MKKIIFLFLTLVSLSVFSQTDSKQVKTSMYIGAGLSMANSKGQAFDVTSYPSIEFGITRSNLSYGLVLGRGNLIGLAQSGDVLSNYFYEVKVSPSFPIGIVNANIILGVGSYFITSNAMFIEYGIGVSKSYGNLTYGVSYTNWDDINYITPSISYGF